MVFSGEPNSHLLGGTENCAAFIPSIDGDAGHWYDVTCPNRLAHFVCKYAGNKLVKRLPNCARGAA